ncbi:MAG: hypothetical protein RL168_257 [Bacteroidota bacterium]
MIFGLIREGKIPPDRRAVLNPAQCAELIALGHSVYVEPSPIRCYADADYAAVGCTLTSNLESCDVLLGVKEVPVDQLHPGATHFFFSHTYKEQPYNRGLLKACLQKNVRLIDWELLKKDGQRLIGFGFYAGLVGAYEALRGFALQEGHPELPAAATLGWVEALKSNLHAHPKGPWRIVLTGKGRVALGAQEMLLAGGFQEVSPEAFLSEKQTHHPTFTVLDCEHYVTRKDGGHFEKQDFYAHPEAYRSSFFPFACAADIYLPCHYWAENSPVFFTAQEAQNPAFSLKFIGDISCDIAGPIPSTVRPSIMADPFYAWDAATGAEVALGTPGSIGVLAVDNLPSAVPGDATTGFGAQFLESILPALTGGDTAGILDRATETWKGTLHGRFTALASYVHALDFPTWNQAQWEAALDQGLAEAKENLDRIASLEVAPTFENTLVALEELTEVLDAVTERLFNENSACTTPEIQALTKAYSPKLAALSNDIRMHPAIFERVKAVYDAAPILDDASRMLLEKTYKGFVRNGALLSPEAQARLREIDERLGQASLEFSEHALKDTEDWQHPAKDADLAALPEAVAHMAREAGKARGLDSAVFTLDAPLYLGVMTYSPSRELREILWRAYAQRGARGDANDNRALTVEIAELRRERAQLLGYESHAAFVLEERMAGRPDTVTAFLSDLAQKALPAAQRDVKALRDFAAKHLDLPELARWDAAYVSEKYKLATLEFDDEMTKPYFPLNRVEAWAFAVAHRLYGLNFRPSYAPTYHPDAKGFDVTNAQGEWVAHLYADWHPRKGKRNGAWMTSYRAARIKNGWREYPVISMVGNFSPPVGDQPALLTFNEVLTLFHEFGHALHGLLGAGRFASLTGTSVRWDFVELPSQFMENWCYQPSELAQWARHYQTGESLPEDLLHRIQASQTFLEGLATVRQLGFGLLDMAWHHRTEAVGDAAALERDALAPVDVWPTVEGSWISPAFSHIFAGGYSAGYYSYKWAEVLDADAFERFQEEADRESEVATDFKALLSAGGSVDPMELYKRFRGREPRPEALLKRAGLHG